MAIRWTNNLGAALIKSVTVEMERHVWCCNSCGSVKNSDTRPKICDSILEEELDYAKLATITGEDAEELRKNYELETKNLEISEGYMTRNDFECLSLADSHPDAWNRTRCESTDIVKETLSEPIETVYGEWLSL